MKLSTSGEGRKQELFTPFTTRERTPARQSDRAYDIDEVGANDPRWGPGNDARLI